MKNTILLVLGIGCFCLYACSSQPSENTSQETAPVESTGGTTETSEGEAAQKTVFEWDPSMDWDAFAFSTVSEAFPDDELNAFSIWEPTDDFESPILFFSTRDEKQFAVLMPGEDTNFRLEMINLPEGSPFSSFRSSTTHDFYYVAQKDVDENGTQELVIQAEIAGMVAAEDGMREADFISLVVLSYDNGTVAYNEALTNSMKQNIGIKDDVSKLTMIEKLNIKYYDLVEMPDTNEKRQRLKHLLIDMNVLSDSPDNAPNKFTQVLKMEDGSYVYSVKEEQSRFYYFVEGEGNSFGLSGVSSYKYPLFVVSDGGNEAYSLTDMKVDGAEISISFESVSEEGTGGQLSLQWKDDFWVMTYNGEYWVTEDAGKDFDDIR
ncbi:MAG: hypothetical protein AAFX87_09790 [Bacteroidota bacterium]